LFTNENSNGGWSYFFFLLLFVSCGKEILPTHNYIKFYPNVGYTIISNNKAFVVFGAGG